MGSGGGGSSAAGSVSGGGDLRAVREVREEEERGGGGGGMRKALVCVRAPHGAGALLIVGGAIVGAAVFAWFRRQRDGGKGEGEGSKNNGEQPVKEEALDGGVVEDEQGDAQRLRRIYENLSRDSIEVGVNESDGKATEELYQIQKDDEVVSKDDEIVSSELVSEAVDKYDYNSVRECAEITSDGMVNFVATMKPFCYENHSDFLGAFCTSYSVNSGRDCANITARGMGTESVTEDDDNSSNMIIENEIIVNEDTKSAENSDESTNSLSSPDITHEEHDNHNYVAQDTASAETTPTTESVIDQEQFLEEAKMSEAAEVKLAEETKTTPLAETAEMKPEEETETTPIVETSEVKPEEEMETTPMVETKVKLAEETETIPIAEAAEMKPAEETETAPMAETAEVKLAEEMDATPMAEATEVKLAEEEAMKENGFEQKEEKVREEPVEPVSSLAYSSVPSMLKSTVKKRLVNPKWNETGMKLEQDCTNGELKDHELTKVGAAMGGAILTMVRRTDSMAILALMFAVTIAITIVMRLYVPLQAT